jgi:DNA-binding response OmpR family regulator
METENSGYDVIRAARNQSYKPVTAILTAFTTAQPELDSVANAVLLKPVGAGELLRRVETLLRSCPRSE